MRNPPWARDELILALDLYFQQGRRQLDASHPAVIALSHLLNRLGIHAFGARDTAFRNPNGVAMKLGNFTSLDPEYTGKGLARGGQLERTIWEEFVDDVPGLHQFALAITRAVETEHRETKSVSLVE